jgi:hypothetical protein
MWRVVDEDSADGTTSHFECFFHMPDTPDNRSSESLRNAYGRLRGTGKKKKE